jgi:hypothetical protein
VVAVTDTGVLVPDWLDDDELPQPDSASNEVKIIGRDNTNFILRGHYYLVIGLVYQQAGFR